MVRIYVVSDATGTTAERVLQAALTQFSAQDVEVVRVGGVRTREQVRAVLDQAIAQTGFIVHTLVSDELRSYMLKTGRKLNIATIDLMGPLLARLSQLLSVEPKAEPGLFRPFDQAYMKRIEAIEFAVRHDDGKNSQELDQAEIVLVGVSRTSKTPLSIYLANMGWKVANVPIVLDIEPPDILFRLPKKRVIGLIIDPTRLALLRKVRAEELKTRVYGYADIGYVKAEVAYAYKIFDRRRDWPLVDVTSKPIEETAAEVVALINGGRDI